MNCCSSSQKRRPVRFDDSYYDDESLLSYQLNTDTRFADFLPDHTPAIAAGSDFAIEHPHVPHVHETNADHFSWHETYAEDSDEISNKKKYIQNITNQYLCGSCYAIALSSVISDCLVVSGCVQWKPDISPTYLMMIVSEKDGNGKCTGGQPAKVVLALEKLPLADSSCIDYSWCANDKELCATSSSEAAKHFDMGNIAFKLNERIPKPTTQGGACYFDTFKYAYRIDRGTNVIYINDTTMTIDIFRNMIKAHIVDFGPPLAGYTVLDNFIDGFFTNTDLNDGIYFDRADYREMRKRLKTTNDDGKLLFSDDNATETKLRGLHAVRVVGWGIGRNVQYDTDSFGDVPYWIAANSWGTNWGKMNGYFRIAMYPFNKYSQFDRMTRVRGFDMGGMILIRATSEPTITRFPSIDKEDFERIVRDQPDTYYKTDVRSRESNNTKKIEKPIRFVTIFGTSVILIFIVVIVISIFVIYRKNKRRSYQT